MNLAIDTDSFNKTAELAHILQEEARPENAASSWAWYCAEDMARFFAQMRMQSPEEIEAIARLDKADPAYIHFLRHIAFRLYVFTGRDDELANWFDAEHLVVRADWQWAVLRLARVYREKTKRGDAKI